MSAPRRVLVLLALLQAAQLVAQPVDTGAGMPADSASAAAQSVPAGTQPVRSLDELLERVRTGGAQRAGEEQAREAQLMARKEDAQAAVEAARAELAAARDRAAALERAWEENDARIAEQQAALRERLGALAEVFAELAAAGGELRARFRESLSAAQLGPAREQALDALLESAASGERLPAIGDFDTLWYELQRELTESGRVRRFDAPVADADGRRGGASVVRIGGFNAVTSEGRYLLWDPEARVLQVLARSPGERASEDAVALAAGTGRLFSLDPGGVRDPAALRAAAAAPTLPERLGRLGAPAWLAMLLGIGGSVFALYRLLRLQRGGGHGELAHCMRRLERVAEERRGLDPIALEIAMDEAVLCELPALTQGLGALRAAGTLAPLLGVLGTVVTLATGAEADLAAGAAPLAGDLAQALLSTALGLCAGIPVLALQALLATRAERLGQRLDEHAAALVSARACGAVA